MKYQTNDTYGKKNQKYHAFSFESAFLVAEILFKLENSQTHITAVSSSKQKSPSIQLA